MNRDWKPGDVGVSKGGERFIVTTKGECFWPGETGRSWSGVSGVPNETDRPLVVIDPEDAEQVKRLADLLSDADERTPPSIDNGAVAQAALREFANPTPRIEQPTGLGAVVESADGLQFVRMHDGWWRGDEPCTVNWAATHAVRVLSEGVPS